MFHFNCYLLVLFININLYTVSILYAVYIILCHTNINNILNTAVILDENVKEFLLYSKLKIFFLVFKKHFSHRNWSEEKGFLFLPTSYVRSQL